MAARSYSSPIRDTQVQQTKERVLEATHALLAASGLDGFTLPKVAQAAGVSIPTVYRYYPSVDDLLREFLAWIRPRLGQTQERLLEISAADVPHLPEENFARYEEHAAVLRALIDSRAFNQIRVGSVSDRAKRGAAVLRDKAPGWSDADLEAAAGAIYALNSPQAWRWLRETWGLDAAQASRGAAWAMRVLVDALAAQPMTKKKGKKR
jgi:AcrR family transcriptional regulator